MTKADAEIWRRFGAAMRLLRKGSGFTMNDVAKRMGVSISRISDLERGHALYVPEEKVR